MRNSCPCKSRIRQEQLNQVKKSRYEINKDNNRYIKKSKSIEETKSRDIYSEGGEINIIDEEQMQLL